MSNNATLSAPPDKADRQWAWSFSRWCWPMKASTRRTMSLFDIKNQSFQVFSFGVIDVDGVVCGLVKLMKYAYVAPALSGCREDSVAEIVLRHHLRAAEGEQDSAVAYALEGFHVESRVAFQRVVQGRPVLGKGRWVEDDEVILVVGRVEKLECIVAEGRVTRVVREVERNVGVGQFDGFRAAVDGVMLSTVLSWAYFSNRERFSRWSTKNPVFCPRSQSTWKRSPFSTAVLSSHPP